MKHHFIEMIAGKLDPITGARMQLPIGGCLTPASRANSSIAIVNRVTCLESVASNTELLLDDWRRGVGNRTWNWIFGSDITLPSRLQRRDCLSGRVAATRLMHRIHFLHFYIYISSVAIENIVKKLPFRSFSLNQQFHELYV